MNKEILTQLLILKDLILQSTPSDQQWTFYLCIILIPLLLFTTCTYTVGRLAFRDALRRNTKMSPEKKVDFANFYLIPYAYFWIYYPVKLLYAFFRRMKSDLKGGSKHD